MEYSTMSNTFTVPWRARVSEIRVISTSNTVVTCAEVLLLATMCSAICLRMGDMGTTSAGPAKAAGGGASEGSETAGAAGIA